MKLESLYLDLFYTFFEYVGNVDFLLTGITVFTCKVYVNQIVLLNVKSN